MKWAGVLFGLLLLISESVLADIDSHALLQQRLNKINGFYGSFEQVVQSYNGQLVQQGSGKLWLKRPYFFNWQMEEPDKITIISDGKTVWMYTVMLEQVTAMNLKDVADNRLLLLLTDNNNEKWQHYRVTNRGNTFFMQPKNNQGQHFEIVINDTGMLNSFTVIEEDGQRSTYQFSHQRIADIANKQFNFVLPDGITIDDQR